MARRARTIKQGMALAFGTYRHNHHRYAAGVDHEAVRRRDEARRENERQGLETCWHCLKGMPLATDAADKCPHCGTDLVPF